MSKFTDIIKNAFEYYDENQMKYYDTIKKFKYYIIDKADPSNRTITFYDKKKDELLKTSYQVIGKFDVKQSIWTWGWSLGDASKEIIDTSRKVLNFGLDLDPTNNISLKTELITSRFRVTHITQIDMHVSVASFLSKKTFVYKLPIYGETNANQQLDVGMSIRKIKTNKENIVNIYYLILTTESHTD